MAVGRVAALHDRRALRAVHQLVDRERHDLRRPAAPPASGSGRPNGKAPLPSSSQASQLMRLGKARPRSSAAITAGSTSRGVAARRRLATKKVQLAGPAGSFGACCELSAATPLLRAKPCAAPVHCPAASFATFSDGPQTFSSRSACRASDLRAQHQPARRREGRDVLRAPGARAPASSAKRCAQLLGQARQPGARASPRSRSRAGTQARGRPGARRRGSAGGAT